jgi:hypothetical protein
MITAPPEVPLALAAVRGHLDRTEEVSLGDTTTREGEASLTFRPAGCPDPDLGFRVLIGRLSEPGAESPAVPYRIIREDS